MSLVEDIKKLAEKATGWGHPDPSALIGLVRARQPQRFRFEDNGAVPNHPRWPLILYRGAVRLDARFDPAAVFEDLFERHGWREAWRNGVYDYLHFHSRIHEVMGVCRGTAVVQFGGTKGKKLTLKKGDVVVLPAGTGHQCFSASEDFLVVGAYPARGTYDVCRPTPKAHDRAVCTVPKVPIPAKDPVYGKGGPLKSLWKRRCSAAIK
jgi:uncharacterized protein YjlB